MTNGPAGAPESGFALTVHHNPFRSPADRRLHVVLALTARATAQRSGGGTPEAAEVLLVDGSGSMNHPPEKMVAARAATKTAIRTLRDGVRFAVVAGTDRAEMLYPAREELAVAGPATRAAAMRAVERLEANWGTVIGNWLLLADRLLATRPNAIRHVLLFTDGRDEHEEPAALEEVLARCAGRFTCDARGIGKEWEPARVKRIAAALGGQADAVREYGEMPADFGEVMRRAMRKRVARVDLRLHTMTGVRPRSIEQVYPRRIDLTGRLLAADDPAEHELDLGSWGEEHREYLLCLDIDPAGRRLEEEFVAAFVRLGSAGAELVDARDGLIRLRWTEDAQRSVLLDPTVAHVTAQAELGEVIEAGCAALRDGRTADAQRQLGRAVWLAHRSDNQEALRRLGRLVDVDDPERGVVRLRDSAELADLLSAEMASEMTSSGFDDLGPRLAALDEAELAAFELPCPHCRVPGLSTDRFCEDCGESMGALAC